MGSLPLDRWRVAGTVSRLPAFVAGRWSAAVARAVRLATRSSPAVRGQVRAHERLESGAVLERVEISMSTMTRRGKSALWNPSVFRVIHDRAVDFLVDEAGVEVARTELLLDHPRVPPELVSGEEAQALLDGAAALIPQLFDMYYVSTVRVRRAALREGDVVEVHGERTEWIDPTVGERGYRETPVRAALRAALILTGR